MATYDGQYELADGQVLLDIDVSIADVLKDIVYPPADHPPTIEQITVWKAHGDGGERGTGPVLGYYSTESAAVAAAKGRAWYGSNGHVENASALKIGDQIWLLASPKPIDLDGVNKKRDAELKEQTLALLTPEQRRVLGV